MWHAIRVSAIRDGNFFPLLERDRLVAKVPRGCFLRDINTIFLNGIDALQFRTFMVVVLNESSVVRRYEVFIKDPNVMENSVIDMGFVLA